MNSRGCANTDILTPHIYSGGYTDDLRVALKHIQNKLPPGTPLIGIGFSLGSNVLVKVNLFYHKKKGGRELNMFI